MFLSVSIHSRCSSMYRYILCVYRYSSLRKSIREFSIDPCFDLNLGNALCIDKPKGCIDTCKAESFEKIGGNGEMLGLSHQMTYKDKILIKSYIFFIGLNSPSSSKQVNKGKGKAL